MVKRLKMSTFVDVFKYAQKHRIFQPAQPVFSRLPDGFKGRSRHQQGIQEFFDQHAPYVRSAAKEGELHSARNLRELLRKNLPFGFFPEISTGSASTSGSGAACSDRATGKHSPSTA